MSNGEPKAWRCIVCGYNHTGDAPPDICPICGVGPEEFKPYKEMLAGIDLDADPALNPDPEPEPEPTDDSASGKPVRNWGCTICGFIHRGPEPPDSCPLCGAGPDQFEPGNEETVEPAAAGTGLRVVVAGAGIAGVSAAEAVRESAPGAEVTLLSHEDLPYYRLNLTRYLAGEVGEGDLPMHPRSWYADQGITLKTGASVTAIRPDDHEIDMSDGSAVPYDKLILTLGAHPFIPPFKGAYMDGAMALRTDDDANTILEQAGMGTKCVCIGGGILGLETAGALVTRGVQVTLLEGFGSLMPRQLNQRAGELIPADLVLITTGVRPNSFQARQAGLEVKQGVVVDDHLQTSAPDIYAAGDVAEHRGICYGIWTAAQFMGKIAGRNAAGVATEFAGIPMSNTLKVLGYDMFSIGRVEPVDGAGRPIEEEIDGNYCRFLFRDGQLIGSVLLGDISGSTAVRTALESGTRFGDFLRTNPTGSQVLDRLMRG
jgi:nitrite reductase (NADH) large subunit